MRKGFCVRGWIKLDDNIDVGEVQSTSSDVGGEEN
jgi:hypothetical protein